MIGAFERMLLVFVLAVFAAVGCGPAVQRTIPSSWIGTEKSRLTAYFKALDQTESVPAGVRADVVRDEAVLASSDARETCFDVTIRTAVEFDVPLDELTLECAVGSNITMPVVSGERVSVRDYGSGGAQRTIVEATPNEEFRSLPLSAPSGNDFRVIERAASLCCPVRTFNYVELSVENPRMVADVGYGPVPYGTSFGWELQQGR